MKNMVRHFVRAFIQISAVPIVLRFAVAMAILCSTFTAWAGMTAASGRPPRFEGVGPGTTPVLPEPTEMLGAKSDPADARWDARFYLPGTDNQVNCGLDDHGAPAPSGVYFARLRTAAGVRTLTLTLAK